MNDVTIHLGSVLVSAVAIMILGALWYSPLLFIKPWMAAVGKKQEDINKDGAGKMYAGMAVVALLFSYVIAHFVVFLNLTTSAQALQFALWTWIGIAIPVTASDYLFAGRSFKLYMINLGYQLVSIVVMALIITLWR